MPDESRRESIDDWIRLTLRQAVNGKHPAACSMPDVAAPPDMIFGPMGCDNRKAVNGAVEKSFSFAKEERNKKRCQVKKRHLFFMAPFFL